MLRQRYSLGVKYFNSSRDKTAKASLIWLTYSTRNVPNSAKILFSCFVFRGRLRLPPLKVKKNSMKRGKLITGRREFVRSIT